MDTAPALVTPRWFRVIAILAVIWMLFGVMAWIMDLMTDETALAQMSEAQRQLYASRPQWLFVVYAIAIFTGLAGAIGLVAKKAWATILLAISLVAIVIQFGYTFTAMHAVEILGPASAVPFPMVIFLIGAALLWFSLLAKRSGWIS